MTNDRPNNDLHGETVVRYWLEKAQEALESAKSEYKAGRLSFAVNSLFLCCECCFAREGQEIQET